jgi:hypothetical protein
VQYTGQSSIDWDMVPQIEPVLRGDLVEKLFPKISPLHRLRSPYPDPRRRIPVIHVEPGQFTSWTETAYHVTDFRRPLFWLLPIYVTPIVRIYATLIQRKKLIT